MLFTSQYRNICLIVLTVSAAVSRCATAEIIRGYHIGNSLTWNALGLGLQSAFQYAGAGLSVGYHIRCGSTLEDIVLDQTVTCVPNPTPYGNWRDAVTQYEWDYIALQTHGGFADPELRAAIDVVAAATAHGRNAAATFFVYSAWPARSGAATYTDVRTQAMTNLGLNTNAFLGQVYDNLVAAYPGTTFGYIPVGEVLLRMDEQLRASPIGSFHSSWDFYSDSHHLNEIGRYIANLTVSTTLTGTRATDLSALQSVSSDMDLALTNLIADSITHVTNGDARVKHLLVPEPTSHALLRGLLMMIAGAMMLALRRGRSLKVMFSGDMKLWAWPLS